MNLASLIAKKDSDLNEEQTKHALVLPILQQVLGWDIFDETRVIPEFTADTPGKGGERVDYALDYEGDGMPEVLIETKPLNSPLQTRQAAQLHRYFTMTDATIGILTDGYTWKLFTDLDKANIMDAEPFIEFTLSDLDTNRQLGKLFSNLSYDDFDLVKLRSWAEVKREENQLKHLVASELRDPSEELLKLFWRKLKPGYSLTAPRAVLFKEKLIQTIKGDDVEKKPSLALIEEIANEAEVRETRAHARGKIIDKFGNVIQGKNLKAAYIEYWSALARDPQGKEMLLKLMDGGMKCLTPVPRTTPSTGKLMSAELADGVHLYVNLSKLGREQQLEELSSALGLGAHIEYDED